MKYYVCIQNCFEDYYFENSPSVAFDDKESAIAYVDSIQGRAAHVFDPKGEIQSYFSDDEFEEFYQLIDVVPSEEYVENDDCYCHMKNSIYSISHRYMMNAQGDIEF